MEASQARAVMVTVGSLSHSRLLRSGHYLHLADSHAVGPLPPDPNDPDLWDWGEDDDDLRPRHPLLRLLLVGIVVVALVLLLVVS
jgi:hypothetical protein